MKMTEILPRGVDRGFLWPRLAQFGSADDLMGYLRPRDLHETLAVRSGYSSADFSSPVAVLKWLVPRGYMVSLFHAQRASTKGRVVGVGSVTRLPLPRLYVAIVNRLPVCCTIDNNKNFSEKVSYEYACQVTHGIHIASHYILFYSFYWHYVRDKCLLIRCWKMAGG